MFIRFAVVTAVVASVVSGTSLRTRELTACPSHSAVESCYIRDLDSQAEQKITDKFMYEPAGGRFSIRCDVDGALDHSKWHFAGEVSDDWRPPFWMKNNDDDDLDKVWDVDYLTTCGEKSFTIEVSVWGVDAPCASKTVSFRACPFECPANSAGVAGTSPILSFDDCECAAGYVKQDGACVIPTITTCRRAAYHLQYAPAVPAGWELLAKRTTVDDSRTIPVTDGTTTSIYIGGIPLNTVLPGTIVAWFVSFNKQPFDLQFVAPDGTLGPVTRCAKNTPIALDVDHSGSIERVIGDFDIDITGDGHIEHLNEWFGPNEGILIDVSTPIENGEVTGLHMFGNSEGFSDGFEKLHSFDANANGYIEGHELDTFAIWTDSNSNAKLDDGELSTLASHNIVSMSTMFHDSYQSYATLVDGSQMYMEDLWFATSEEEESE